MHYAQKILEVNQLQNNQLAGKNISEVLQLDKNLYFKLTLNCCSILHVHTYMFISIANVYFNNKRLVRTFE